MYIEICPEPNPKWGGLTEILKEIGHNSKDNAEIVLVLVQSAKTCHQLKNVIIIFIYILTYILKQYILIFIMII